MAKIYVFLADGCEEIEALTPVDLLRRAGEDVCTVSIMGRKEVTGSHKITILADETIEEGEFDDGDMLVLPGGMPGTLNLAGNETLAALIRSYDDQGKKLAAICAAPSILGVMGILKDKNAVCFPGFEEKLAGANVLDVPAVTDKNVTTGRGMGAATDFALELICRERTKQKKWRKKSYFIAKKKPKNHRNIKKSLAFLKRVCYTR